MARYVDGFLLPMPKKNVGAYRRIARKAGLGRAIRWRSPQSTWFPACLP